MSEQAGAQAAALETLQSAFLEGAVHDVLAAGPEASGCDPHSFEVLQQTAQVAEALQQLQLDAASCQEPPVGTGPPQAGDDAGAAAFAGALSTRLGVQAAEVLSEALPPQVERQAAVAGALPALEAALHQRCADVATASGYWSTSNFTGLPDHMLQLQAASAAAAAQQAEAQADAAEQAGGAVGLLARASQLLASLLKRHKLQGYKEANEAHSAALLAECTFLREKLRVVQLQLRQVTYTPGVLAVLRDVAQVVEEALTEATTKLQEATSRLERYTALGPGFAALATEHGAVLDAIEEAEYELRELEQFRELARVNG